MTDYKALYEQQLFENKQLQEQIKDLEEEVEERTTYAVLPAEGQFIDENKKLKEEIECLEISLTIVKGENETNKKNLQKFMEENKKLKESQPKKKTIIKNKKKKPDQSPKVIKVTDEEEVETIRKKGGGSLMFPSQYRKLDIKDIHWKDIRKKYDLKGRWEAYCLTEFGETLPKQNKDVKYIHPHFVSQDWEGAYNGGVETWNKWVTDYVYGDVLLVKL